MIGTKFIIDTWMGIVSIIGSFFNFINPFHLLVIKLVRNLIVLSLVWPLIVLYYIRVLYYLFKAIYGWNYGREIPNFMKPIITFIYTLPNIAFSTWWPFGVPPNKDKLVGKLMKPSDFTQEQHQEISLTVSMASQVYYVEAFWNLLYPPVLTCLADMQCSKKMMLRETILEGEADEWDLHLLNATPQVWIFSKEEQVRVVIQGTSNLEGWAIDLTADPVEVNKYLPFLPKDHPAYDKPIEAHEAIFFKANQLSIKINDYLARNPDERRKKFIITGHSLGGGYAVALHYLLKYGTLLGDVTTYAYAPPAIFDQASAEAFSNDGCHVFINFDDVVPRMSYRALYEVMLEFTDFWFPSFPLTPAPEFVGHPLPWYYMNASGEISSDNTLFPIKIDVYEMGFLPSHGWWHYHWKLNKYFNVIKNRPSKRA